jgi:hypothetical protein
MKLYANIKYKKYDKKIEVLKYDNGIYYAMLDNTEYKADCFVALAKILHQLVKIDKIRIY